MDNATNVSQFVLNIQEAITGFLFDWCCWQLLTWSHQNCSSNVRLQTSALSSSRQHLAKQPALAAFKHFSIFLIIMAIIHMTSCQNFIFFIGTVLQPSLYEKIKQRTVGGREF